MKRRRTQHELDVHRAKYATELTRDQYRDLIDRDSPARLLPGEPEPAWATKHDATLPPPVVQLGQGRQDPDLGEPWKWVGKTAAWFGIRLAFAYGVIQMCVAVGGGSR